MPAKEAAHTASERPISRDQETGIRYLRCHLFHDLQCKHWLLLPLEARRVQHNWRRGSYLQLRSQCRAIVAGRIALYPVYVRRAEGDPVGLPASCTHPFPQVVRRNDLEIQRLRVGQAHMRVATITP